MRIFPIRSSIDPRADSSEAERPVTVEEIVERFRVFEEVAPGQTVIRPRALRRAANEAYKANKRGLLVHKHVTGPAS